jgi:hypothetical protein
MAVKRVIHKRRHTDGVFLSAAALFIFFTAAAGAWFVSRTRLRRLSLLVSKPWHYCRQRIPCFQQLLTDIHIRRDVLEKVFITGTQIVVPWMAARRNRKTMFGTATVANKAKFAASALRR